MISVTGVNIEADGSPRVVYEMAKRTGNRWERFARTALFLEQPQVRQPENVTELPQPSPVIASTSNPFKRVLEWMTG